MEALRVVGIEDELLTLLASIDAIAKHRILPRVEFLHFLKTNGVSHLGQRREYANEKTHPCSIILLTLRCVSIRRRESSQRAGQSFTRAAKRPTTKNSGLAGLSTHVLLTM